MKKLGFIKFDKKGLEYLEKMIDKMKRNPDSVRCCISEDCHGCIFDRSSGFVDSRCGNNDSPMNELFSSSSHEQIYDVLLKIRNTYMDEGIYWRVM